MCIATPYRLCRRGAGSNESVQVGLGGWGTTTAGRAIQPSRPSGSELLAHSTPRATTTTTIYTTPITTLLYHSLATLPRHSVDLHLTPPLRSLVAFVHGHTSPRPLTMLLLDRGHVATALGYASIGCWLCAQLPFVLSWRAPSSSTQRYLPLATRVHCSFHYCLQHYGCANTRRQVIKNYQLASCDGLSFPFLVTWLFGMSPRVAIAALFKALTSYRRLHQPHRLHPH